MGQTSVLMPMILGEHIESQDEEKSGKRGFHNARRKVAICMDEYVDMRIPIMSIDVWTMFV
jgi:hypothetical protein